MRRMLWPHSVVELTRLKHLHVRPDLVSEEMGLGLQYIRLASTQCDSSSLKGRP